MKLIGTIYQVELPSRMIAIKTYHRILYLYFHTGQLSIFKRYLFEGVYIHLEYNEERTFLKNGILAHPVDFVYQIYYFNIYKKISYYDKNELNNSLSRFLSSLGNMMFLDLEMTMPSYHQSGKDHTVEIIQAGYLLVDANGDEITRYSHYIKPVKNPSLNTRTIKFLNLKPTSFYAEAISYEQFYADFKEIIENYHPTIIIYGKNDSLVLEHSYAINLKKSLTKQTRFVNLCKLVRDYYNLRNDIGLFKLYQTYYQNETLQVHDAFNDCEVTKEVFKAFQKEVNHRTDFFPQIKKIMEPK